MCQKNFQYEYVDCLQLLKTIFYFPVWTQVVPSGLILMPNKEFYVRSIYLDAGLYRGVYGTT